MTGDPIAYTYDAAEHCPACARARFGSDDHGFVPEDAEDSEGNGIGAVFGWDEIEPDRGLYCDTCGAEIVEALPYVVVENTPGYLPEDDDPGRFATLDEARVYASDRLSDLLDHLYEAHGLHEDSGGLPFRVVGSFAQGDDCVIVYDLTRTHDLGRVIDIIDTRAS